MPFPVRLLSVDEEVAVETRPHWTYLAGQLGVFVVFAAVAIVVTAVGFPLPAVVVTAVLAGVTAVALGIRLVRWANTYYLVTDRRIVYWKGVPRWRGIELRLDLVDEIGVTQTIWGRLVGVGTLAVHSVVEGHVRNLAFVPHPVDVRREVYRLLREAEVRRLEAARAPEAAHYPEADRSPEAAQPREAARAPEAAHYPEADRYPEAAQPREADRYPDAAHYPETDRYPEAAQPAGEGEAPGVSLDIPDQIRKLYELVELGILSRAEFEEKKRDLLGRL